MNFDEIVYYSLLAAEDNEYCCQTLKDWTRDQLLETIQTAHLLVDQGHVLFEDVQPLIQLCTKSALSCIPEGSDDFSPPFSCDQVESLVWLLEDDPASFDEHYSACSQQVLSDCIYSVQSLVSQAVCESAFVQPLLQAWSDLLSLAKPHYSSPAINHLLSKRSISPSPMATSATTQFNQLPTKYYHPVSKCCTHPAFNSPVSSPPPVTVPQNPSLATVPWSSFCPATFFAYSPAPTYKTARAKPKK